MKKIAVILAGCGARDGSEIHESVSTLLAISQNGAEYSIFAPDKNQHSVVNHITGKETGETRNMMIEAARIARGNIKPTTEFNINNFDAVIFPGGSGSAKNIFTYLEDGADCSVLPEIENIIKSTYKAKKPIGALCIAPMLIAKVLGNGVEITTGNDDKFKNDLKVMNTKYVLTSPTEAHTDVNNKVVTTSCYTYNVNIAEVFEGANNVVKSVLELV